MKCEDCRYLAADFSTDKGHVMLVAHHSSGIIEILDEAILEDFPTFLKGKSWCGEFKESEVKDAQ